VLAEIYVFRAFLNQFSQQTEMGFDSMAKIEFPKHLKRLLEDSEFQSPIRALADRAGEILADNKLPFFPDYTDHGTDHINCVLKSQVELVPSQIWDASGTDSAPRLLCDADAAVIIGATLLHDIAMHLRVEGFRELIKQDSRFRPLPWFKEDHEGHAAETPWKELWDDYAREAQRFTDRQLTNIIGEESARTWKFHRLPEDAGRWEANHYLIIGEFVRRHHARLAHEIAVYGFPGLPVGSGEGQFPAMGKEEGHVLMRLADLIGLTARSHGTSLRLCKSYLDASPLYPGTPRPMGTAVFYPMALLRVADYLQIDQQRAPAVLLKLRSPQSPVSVREWKKHRAVQNIGPATDPRGKLVVVSTDLSLSLYLQLRDLLADLQAEMDHSTAVLDEFYGSLTELGLNQLSLTTRRVYTNLQSPAYRSSLPYVPNQTGFTADPHLLTLLVEPLYGKQPSVGIRELVQNAADAVCELEAWCEARGASIGALERPDQDCDVLVEFIKREDGGWFLRVRDKGVGMTADTIQNYFLRAGASFRRSSEWAKEYLDEKGHPRVVRAGRFGIGAFAVFLLGDSFKLWTRHAGVDDSQGYFFEASANSQLIEIRRQGGLPIGTTIEVELSGETARTLGLEKDDRNLYSGSRENTDWFCWNWPKVEQRVIREEGTKTLEPKYACPVRKGALPPDWSEIHPAGFDAVFWTFVKAPQLSCNGLKVVDPDREHVSMFVWPTEIQLQAPRAAVIDSAANLPMTTQRYALSEGTLPFIAELARDVTLSFIAYALVCGPVSRADAMSLFHVHPLQFAPVSQYATRGSVRNAFSKGLLRWCATATEMTPADPWLCSLLGATTFLVYGAISHSHRDTETDDRPDRLGLPAGLAILPWYGWIDRDYDDESDEELPAAILSELARNGVAALDLDMRASYLLASTNVTAGFERQSYSRYEPMIQWSAERFDANNPHVSAKAPSLRQRYIAEKGDLKPSLPLGDIIEAIEGRSDEDAGPRLSRHSSSNAHVHYAAEIVVNHTAHEPATPLALIWRECLGDKAIPFDPKARKALIAAGSRHPELKRHIEAWKKMGRRASRRAD
jgi:hypothetical protein